jgi:hypothetical protein
MTNNAAPVHSDDNAKVWTGIRDVPIWAGESSRGNQLPLGPYRTPELIAIGIIMVPAIFWVTSNTQSPNVWSVLIGAPVLTLVIVIILRILLPKSRPDAATRMAFLFNAWLPRPITTSAPAKPATRPVTRTHPTPPRKPSAR